MAGDINRVTLVGRLTRDPELRHLPSGSPVLQLGVACNGRQKDEAGNWTDKPNFFDVKVFGNQAEMLSQHLAKGRRIGIDGRLDWSLVGGTGRVEALEGRDRRLPGAVPRQPQRQRRGPVLHPAVGRQRRPHGLRPRRSGGEHRRRHPLLRQERRETAWHNEKAERRAQAPVPVDRSAPAEELLLLQGEDRRGRLQELQPAPPLRLGEGQDPLTAHHGRVQAAPGADRGRGQARA